MKTELVNPVTTGGTETVVLLSTELDELAAAERFRALELAVCLKDEGWTVVTAAHSTLAPASRVLRRTPMSRCSHAPQHDQRSTCADH